MRHPHLNLLALVLLSSSVAFSQERQGEVKFSDGSSVSGTLSLSPGGELHIQNGGQVHRLALDRLSELRIAPERITMEQAERVKPGQNELEYYGEKYPLLNFAVTATLGDGSKISGHLTTTVLYVSSADTLQKVLLASQQRGQPGQPTNAVVYPEVVSFHDATSKSSATVPLKLNDLPTGSRVAGLAYGTLDQLEATAGSNEGEFTMASPPGDKFFLAVRSGMNVQVGWPKDSDPKLADDIREAFKKTRDFYDDRHVLGAFQDTASGDIYCVSVAGRKGDTFRDKKAWECEMCRWKKSEDGRLMLAARGIFFRDATEGKAEILPHVELTEKLWEVHPTGDLWNDTAQ